MKTPLDPARCREEVWIGSGAWRMRWEQCRYRAVTAAGYCRTHDPELKAAREAKRGPTKWEKQSAARIRLAAILDELALHDDGTVRALAIEASGLLRVVRGY